MRIHAKQLARRRLKEDAVYQYKALRSAVDWTVMLYFIVPGIFFAVIGYRSLWTDDFPAWIEYMPASVVAALLFLCARRGNVRVLVQEADVLFLRQKESWVHALTQVGCLYSMTLDVLISVLAYVAVLPIGMRSFGWIWGEWTGLLLFHLCYSMLWSLLNNRIQISLSGWRRWVIKWGVTAAGGVLYVAIVLRYSQLTWLLVGGAVLWMALLVLLMRSRIRCVDAFEQDILVEGKQRMRLTGLLLHNTLDRSPWFRMRRPMLFRHSNHLFSSRQPHLVVAELAIKSVYRSNLQLKTMLQLLGAGIAAVLLTPTMIKIIVFVLLTLLVWYWMQGVWHDFVKSAYVKMFRWREEDLRAAKPIAVYGLMLPITVVLGLVMGLLIQGIWGGLIAIPVSALFGWIIVHTIGAVDIRK
ncbi:ABC transporter permease [Paenibacillus guangzhouensis]|uniref:ABC transporter permease n=1 Tax=Paenibacillus guangzhouensis TaxID=1473112 RepID=UPI00126746EA|nr:ABC transporter permease [Paenibacillus guangzhouensis]